MTDQTAPAGDEDLVVSAGEITTLRINRPHRGNSVTPEFIELLADTATAAADDESVRGLVLTGTGRIFCSGADIKEMAARIEADGVQGYIDYQCDVWMPAVQRALFTIWQLEIPVVAALNGSATAGGLDLALCADYRIAAGSAQLGESYAKLGIVPVGGGALLLPLLAPAGKAAHLLFSGELITAPEAAALGIVDEVVHPSRVTERAVAEAQRLSAGHRTAVASVKRLMRAQTTAAFPEHLAAALDTNRRLLHDPSVLEFRQRTVGRFGFPLLADAP